MYGNAWTSGGTRTPGSSMACKGSGVQSPQLHQAQRITRSLAQGHLSADWQQITSSVDKTLYVLAGLGHSEQLRPRLIQSTWCGRGRCRAGAGRPRPPGSLRSRPARSRWWSCRRSGPVGAAGPRAGQRRRRRRCRRTRRCGSRSRAARDPAAGQLEDRATPLPEPAGLEPLHQGSTLLSAGSMRSGCRAALMGGNGDVCAEVQVEPL